MQFAIKIIFVGAVSLFSTLASAQASEQPKALGSCFRPIADRLVSSPENLYVIRQTKSIERLIDAFGALLESGRCRNEITHVTQTNPASAPLQVFLIQIQVCSSIEGALRVYLAPDEVKSILQNSSYCKVESA